MLARHRLAVGKVGLVGYVTAPERLAWQRTSVRIQCLRQPRPSQTQSELALRCGSAEADRALDVQSGDPRAFAEEDVLVLQTMADSAGVASRMPTARAAIPAGTRRSKVLELYGG
jgi:hypothetical protein